MRPVIIKVIPNPRRGAGTLEYFSFSRIAAIPTMARNQPTPEPKPNTVASVRLAYSRSCMNSAPPRIAQFTAISGRKIPRELYRAGENFSMIISTNCTMEAITAMNMMKVRKLRSISARAGLIHFNAPEERR